MCLIGALPWVRGGLLFVTQILGGMAAAGLVQCMFPGDLNVRTTLGGGTSITHLKQVLVLHCSSQSCPECTLRVAHWTPHAHSDLLSLTLSSHLTIGSIGLDPSLDQSLRRAFTSSSKFLNMRRPTQVRTWTTLPRSRRRRICCLLLVSIP